MLCQFLKKKFVGPTRDFMFKVTTDTLALRVSLFERGKRVVSWIKPLDSHKSTPDVGICGVSWVDKVKLQRLVAVGLVVTKSQAQA